MGWRIQRVRTLLLATTGYNWFDELKQLVPTDP